MNKFAAFAAVAVAFSAPAFAADSIQGVAASADAAAPAVSVNPGKMLYGANGQRIAAIYRVTSEGNPQVILNGKLVTVPASSLSDVSGKVTTSLSKAELGRAR